jgi:AhpD family alkylhydroperoxidase
MARVKDLNPTELQGSSRQVYERILDGYGPYRNMLSVFAHRPPALDHIFSYLLQSKADGLISPRHLEIALLTASKAHVCEYCVAHHEPKSLEQGLSQETVDRLLDDDVPGLDPVELLVRDYALQVTQNAARVTDAFHNRLREHFSEEQIVELTIRIALCSFFKRVNEALDVVAEDDVALEFAPRSAEAVL